MSSGYWAWDLRTVSLGLRASADYPDTSSRDLCCHCSLSPLSLPFPCFLLPLSFVHGCSFYGWHQPIRTVHCHPALVLDVYALRVSVLCQSFHWPHHSPAEWVLSPFPGTDKETEYCKAWEKVDGIRSWPQASEPELCTWALVSCQECPRLNMTAAS